MTQVVATNLMGTISGSHAAMRHFKQRRRGTLINIASGLGKIPTPYYASYVASKFGITGVTRLAAQESAPYGVRVNSVHPGYVDTPILGDTDRNMLTEATPMGRLGTAEEIAATGGHCEPFALDVTDADACEAAFDHASIENAPGRAGERVVGRLGRINKRVDEDLSVRFSERFSRGAARNKVPPEETRRPQTPAFKAGR